jgi:hypothetical protein
MIRRIHAFVENTGYTDLVRADFVEDKMVFDLINMATVKPVVAGFSDRRGEDTKRNLKHVSAPETAQRVKGESPQQ